MDGERWGRTTGQTAILKTSFGIQLSERYIPSGFINNLVDFAFVGLPFGGLGARYGMAIMDGCRWPCLIEKKKNIGIIIMSEICMLFWKEGGGGFQVLVLR